MMLLCVGVYQYLVNVSDCSTDSLDDTLELVSLPLHLALNKASLNGHNFSSIGPIT